MTTSPPSVLILALAQERFLYSGYAQLMESMKSCATVTQVETKGEFAREMKLSPPTVVIAIDAEISEPENSVVLQRLLQYTREGGTTICCCNFSGAIHNGRVKTFCHLGSSMGPRVVFPDDYSPKSSCDWNGAGGSAGIVQSQVNDITQRR
ncbi:uncharacterized protein ARMOST_12254 [Armillaria ostoyae]|uniref:Uncharacterized protein n=1 Tax=Armillaria ostoyae TaxID=47428 RepID=A0A284RJH0_ARMOS|nr:uncharacterized protein ARMOST_12254 [Armillaria ostoyae]